MQEMLFADDDPRLQITIRAWKKLGLATDQKGVSLKALNQEAKNLGLDGRQWPYREELNKLNLFQSWLPHASEYQRLHVKVTH